MKHNIDLQKKTFREEYLEILKKYDIEFKDEYLFDFHEDRMR
ncbi:MAG: hypothetical protein P1P88_15420 [Bacteroidales bacterium]|nr:hypothetical protein [Bacteroidales bacterium]